MRARIGPTWAFHAVCYSDRAYCDFASQRRRAYLVVSSNVRFICAKEMDELSTSPGTRSLAGGTSIGGQHARGRFPQVPRAGCVVITVEGVSKAYGKFTAVDDVSFVCRPGTVTGFLGPNGAGKTTTLRILVGLTLPSKGSTHVGGHHYAQIPNPGLHIGVLLDASAQHPGRTGREVLKLSANNGATGQSR